MSLAAIDWTGACADSVDGVNVEHADRRRPCVRRRGRDLVGGAGDGRSSVRKAKEMAARDPQIVARRDRLPGGGRRAASRRGPGASLDAAVAEPLPGPEIDTDAGQHDDGGRTSAGWQDRSVRWHGRSSALAVAVVLGVACSSRSSGDATPATVATPAVTTSVVASSSTGSIGPMPAAADLIVSGDDAVLIVPLSSGLWRPATSATAVAIDGAVRPEDFLSTSGTTLRLATSAPSWEIDSVRAFAATSDGSGDDVAVVVTADFGSVTFETGACLDMFVTATSAEFDGVYLFRVDTGAPSCPPPGSTSDP
jgi:hypothetical protein